MITDKETNKVYFSSLIKDEKYQDFWTELKRILEKHNIPYDFIEGTRDIWCRDYMPIQLEKNEFVQFKYFPDYCLDYDNVKYLTIQDELRYNIPDEASIKLIDLIVDGGNIVKSGNKVIMTEKVISENQNRLPESVVKMLKKALKVDEIYFIPVQPEDYTGHSDGMVRFLENGTLLVNDYSVESDSWQKKFWKAIDKIEPKPETLAYAHSEKKVESDWTADGCYINFAQIGNIIIFPQFKINEDGKALSKIKELYPEPKFHIEPIDARIIAERGGVLNCMTWNIYKHILDFAIEYLLPIYGGEDYLLVIRSDEKLPFTDTVCHELYPDKGIVGNAWSLQKLMKRVEPIAEISESQVSHYQDLLSKMFSVEQLSDVLKQIMFPNKSVFEELIDIPEKLKGYKPRI